MSNSLLRVFVIASLVLFGGLYFYSSNIEKHYKDGATRYLNVALENISDWQSHSLRAQLARETQHHVSNEQLTKLTDHYRHFGRFQSMDEPRLSRLSAALSAFSKHPRLSYSSQVHFEGGKAIMTATLTLEDERFKFYNFSLSPSQNQP
ncbi:MAG: hypothetical protein ACSHWQ_02730 [Spongiibacteraceae bacterium]